jgi:hypothetical protein
MKSNRMAGIALATMLASGPAMADVLYDDAYSPTVDGGNCLFDTHCAAYFQPGDDIFVAQGFSLGSSAAVVAASFTEMDGAGMFVGPTSVDWALYADADGLPGAQIASGTSPFMRKINITTDPYGYFIDSYTFGLGEIPLAAGKYFLAFQEMDTNVDNYLMEGVTDSGAAQSNNGGATWQTGYVNGTFGGVAASVYGRPLQAIPEPASLLVFAAGLATLALRRRRAA